MEKKDAYNLYMNTESGEIHIYKGYFDLTPPCITSVNSVCSGFRRDDHRAVQVKRCLDEHEARQFCAEHGRAVCAHCMQELYETRELDNIDDIKYSAKDTCVDSIDVTIIR